MTATAEAEGRHPNDDMEGLSDTAQVAKEKGGDGTRPNALHEANIFHSAFFRIPLVIPPAASSSSTPDDGILYSSALEYNKPKNERLCLGGHRETIFGLSFSPDGVYFATASQDSTIGIWSVKSHRLVTTLKEGMDVKFECLRVTWSMGRESNFLNGGNKEKYVLASAGADGIARLWSAFVPNSASLKTDDDTHTNSNNDEAREEPLTWRCVGLLDHYMFEKKERNGSHSQKEMEEEEESDDKEEDDDNDCPQIYALQFIQSKKMSSRSIVTNTECTNNENNTNVRLLTSTNDYIYLWDVIALGEYSGSDKMPQSGGITNLRKFHLQTMIQFAHINDDTRYNINAFGGERNPDNALFVFDASHCEMNDLLGVALSDGTCRVLCNGNSDDGDQASSSSYQERCVLGLPPDYFGNNRGGGHLTALSWDTSGTRLATCLASGRVVLWSIHTVKKGIDGMDVLLQPSCISVLDGGTFT